MGPGQRVLKIVADVLVKLLVFLFLDVLLGPRPQRRRLVDPLVLDCRRRVLVLAELLHRHDHRQGDVVGILGDDRAQLPLVQQLALLLAQVQGHFGAARGLVHRFQRVFALAAGLPQHAVFRPHAGAAGAQRDLVGDDEAGIEADAELADQIRILGLIAGQLLHELAGAGTGDGADVINDLLPVHADAVVGDGDGAGVLVETDPDVQIGIALVQGAVGQGFKAQLVAGVGGVGNQFAEEDFLVGVQRMRDQAQQLLHLGLKTKGFLVGFDSHEERTPDGLGYSRFGVRYAGERRNFKEG